MPEDTIRTIDRTQSHGRVTVERYDADALRTALPQWENLSKERKLAVVRLLSPVRERTTTNSACKGQHELLASYLCRAEDPTEAASHLAVGTDNGSSPAYGNESLNNEGYRTTVTDSATDGTTIVSTVFLDATEANDLNESTSGNKIREVGLVTTDAVGDGLLLNHALVSPEEKSSSVALTVTVELSWEAA